MLDNCVGQNKSNTTHKFSMLTSLVIFPEGVTDIYFKVGHSHNHSDQKTGHAAKALSKKNLYTPQAVAKEVNKVKGLFADVLNDKDVFHDWKPFLDKHFKNMDPGFTSHYIFHFKDGVVEYRELNDEGDEVVVKSKVYCANPLAVKKVILRELFNLNAASNPVEICKARLRLPPLPQKRISEKKIESMKTLYQQIPRQFRWFYPEGQAVQDDLHIDLRVRAAALGLLAHHGGDSGAGGEVLDGDGAGDSDGILHGGVEVGRGNVQHPVALVTQDVRKKRGRPRTVPQASSDQPAIHRFFDISWDKTPNLSGPSRVSSTPKTVPVGKRNFIEDGSDDSDISTEDEADLSKELQKKRKVVDIFDEIYGSDTEDIPEVTSDRDNIESTEDAGATDKDSNNDDYSVDVNENLGKIILKIQKRT